MNTPPAPLTREEAGPDPMALFRRWYAEAEGTALALPEAAALATVDAAGRPRARMVLLKDCAGEGFVFYTNRGSDKARELAARPEAALTFWWEPLQRQVRAEGAVRELDAAASDAYFAGRPRASRLGAWASRQSAPAADRAQLERQYRAAEARFAGRDVPRPEFWGGYVLAPRLLEFWQNAPSRMHDRICYRRDAAGAWRRTRLSP